MISDILAEGRENARTGAELAQFLNCNVREITAQIERERRQGQPICAATGEKPGYFLAKNDQELEDYCNQLKSRAIEIFTTRKALVSILRQIRDKEA